MRQGTDNEEFDIPEVPEVRPEALFWLSAVRS